uniref:Predicted integral membrane protein n=1 Tax=Caenorhabditis tropicalis TaxID=1561998 RepID=A0A1I7THF6_9PELO
MLDIKELILKIKSSLETKPGLAISTSLIVYLLYQINQSFGTSFIAFQFTMITYLSLAVFVAVKVYGWTVERMEIGEIKKIKDHPTLCRGHVLYKAFCLTLLMFTGYLPEPISVTDIISFLIFVFLVPVLTEVLISRYVTHRVEKFIHKRNIRFEDILIAFYASVLSMDLPCSKWVAICCSTVIVFEAMQIQRVIQAKVVLRNEQEAEIQG